jgi:hypothetical protein
LKEIDIRDGKTLRPTFVNKTLETDPREMIGLLKECSDFFAWNYTEMLELSQEIVEHWLPIKSGFRPFKQKARTFRRDLLPRIKDEIHRLLEANFIRPCRYTEWVSNVVPVEKKESGKLRVCIDFRNLNRATPKDEYPMPIADTLINNASGNRIISFLDGNAGYNQIFMAEEDASKTAVICPGFIGLFESVVMTFGLKNFGATYQRSMNLIFHELLGNTVEVYIDDIVVKSAKFSSHIADLRKAFDKMHRYGLKMNPRKCAFGVSAGKSLGFVIHEHGIEIDPDRINTIRNVGPPTCKLEVQKFLGKVNYLRRFISNLAGKIDAFTPILRLKNDAEFTWGAEQQEAFDLIRKYLSLTPVLKAPQVGVPFRLYIAAEDKVIGAVLTQETEGKEHVVTYLSRRLVEAETRYTFIEKLCLFHACNKCRCYLLSSHCTVSGQTYVIKYMLQNPIMSGRIGKWAYALIEYDLAYEPLKSMKGQVIADFIVEHRIDDTHKLDISYLTVTPWTLYFDGSVCNEGQGIGIMLVSTSNVYLDFSSRLKLIALTFKPNVMPFCSA